MTERTLGGGGAGGDFTKERQELPDYGGDRMTERVEFHALCLIYSCVTLERI